jgi:hypothetical protein
MKSNQSNEPGKQAVLNSSAVGAELGVCALEMLSVRRLGLKFCEGSRVVSDD